MSLSTCTEETLPEQLATKEETLCEETHNEQTLLEPLEHFCARLYQMQACLKTSSL